MPEQIEFSRTVDPSEVGADPQALTQLHELFDQQMAEGLHNAAQMVVVKDGQVLMDRASGSFGGQSVRPDTPFYCFSVSKALTGMCVHKLIDEGKVELDAPVADYWPAFARKGKGGVTIKEVFTHTAGVPAFERYRQIPLWPFWRLTTADTAGLPLEFAPGSQMAYHAVTWGTILGEVVRRVGGMPFEAFFQRHFAQPLGLNNTWYRIPLRDLRRSPRMVCGSDDMETLVRVFNLLPIRRAVIPAASVNSTARELAIFYQMLVNQGRFGGRQYLKQETVQQAASLSYRGWDEIVERDTLWACGFHLGGRDPENSRTNEETVFGERSTRASFGHMGNRSCMAWGDMDHRLVVAFTCERLIGYDESRARWIALNNAVWDVLGV